MQNRGHCKSCGFQVLQSQHVHTFLSTTDFIKIRTTQTGYRTTSVGCKGESRYVEGCRGLPYLKTNKFIGFLVSWLLVLWFQHFTKCPFHAFRKILIPHPRFPRLYSTDRRDYRRPSFRDCSFFWISEVLRFIKYHFLNTNWDVLGLLEVSWGRKR